MHCDITAIEATLQSMGQLCMDNAIAPVLSHKQHKGPDQGKTSAPVTTAHNDSIEWKQLLRQM